MVGSREKHETNEKVILKRRLVLDERT